MNSSPEVILEGLPENDDTRRVAWWYCGLSKNNPAPSESKVEVCFREIHNDNTLGKEFFHYHVGITNLGQVPLGTIWQGHNRVGQIDKVGKEDIKVEVFQLDFNDGNWEFGKSWGKMGEKLRIIPPFMYELPDNVRHSLPKVVAFHFTLTPYGLIIPCLEIFSRLYGRSQYIKKILLANSLDVAMAELIVPDVVEAPSNTWQVTLDKHCHDTDAVFLAHLKYDLITQKRVRPIWGQSEGTQGPTGNVQAFPQIGPWFEGAAQIKVRGLWLDKKKERFLALQILKCSDPEGVEIYLDRQNTNLTGPLKKIKDKTTWPRAIKKPFKDKKEIILRYSEEPGSGLNTQKIQDQDYETLGQKRKVTKIIRDHTSEREKRTVTQKNPADECSGGDSHGENDKVDKADIFAPQKLESQGTLRDVWNTLVNLAADPKYGIKSLTSVSANNSVDDSTEPITFTFSDSTEPITFTFSDLKIEKGLNIRKQKWLFLDPSRSINNRISRCVLLVRVETKLGIGYVMEVQRRMKFPKGGMPEEKDKFKGFVFCLENDSDLTVWLPSFLENLARAKGIWDVAQKYWPQVADTYKHVHDKQGSLKNTVLNALSKIKIINQNNKGTSW